MRPEHGEIGFREVNKRLSPHHHPRLTRSIRGFPIEFSEDFLPALGKNSERKNKVVVVGEKAGTELEFSASGMWSWTRIRAGAVRPADSECGCTAIPTQMKLLGRGTLHYIDSLMLSRCFLETRSLKVIEARDIGI